MRYLIKFDSLLCMCLLLILLCLLCYSSRFILIVAGRKWHIPGQALQSISGFHFLLSYYVNC